MEGIRPPGSINFDGNNVADAWEKFYEQFEWYLCAIGLDEASDMRKISLFLNVAGLVLKHSGFLEHSRL